MLISVQRLIDRWRHPASRADELATLRRRLVAEPTEVPVEEAHAARALRELAARLAAAQADAGQRACHACAAGRPEPHGHWRGGFCCGGPTEGVFSDDELGALRLAGTTPARLSPPAPTDHAGCAFRGPAGCSLDVADRPSICIHYMCRELGAEVAAAGKLAALDALAAELVAAFARYRALRAARLDDEAIGLTSAR